MPPTSSAFLAEKCKNKPFILLFKKDMNPWLLLAISIGLEIAATNLLKLSDGFTKIIPTSISLGLYAISFYFLSIIFRSLPVGIVYAVWSGVGIVLTAVVAYFAFGQKPDTPALIGMGLIIAGVLVINLFSQSSH